MTQEMQAAPEMKSGDASEAFGEFMHAFEAFKEANDERLAAIERKASADGLTVEKVDRINHAMDEQKRLIDQLVLKGRRPALGGDSDRGLSSLAAIEHKAAFDAYVRRGAEDGLRALEAKALAVSTNSGADGGYTVPDEVEKEIGRRLASLSPMRAISSVRAISANVYKKAFSTTAAATGWVAETDSRTQTSTPTLAELQFPAMELTEAGTGTDTSRAVTPAGLFPAQADVASASTCNIGAASTSQVNITGTTTITAFDSVAAGIYRQGTFAGALTLTHNATSLKLPGGANISTAANDRFGALSLGSGNWIVLWYQKADGTPLAGGGGGGGTAASQSDMESASSTSVFVSPGRQQYHPGHPKWWLLAVVSSGVPANTASYGVSSLTDTGTGDLTINLSTSFSSGNNTAVSTTALGSGTGTLCIAISQSAGTSTREMKSLAASGGSPTDPSNWQVAGFGDQ